MSSPTPSMSPQRPRFLIVLLVAALALSGIGAWTYFASEKEPGQAPASTSASAPSEGVAPVSVAPASGTASASGSDAGGAASPAGPMPNQEPSAREALDAVVPKWASYDTAAWGTDTSQWLASWSSDPHADSVFRAQSERDAAVLWSSVFSMDVDAKGATLKDVQLSWKSGNLSGWNVTVERSLTSADGSGTVQMSESVTWEFTVEQQEDGTSRVIGFVPVDESDE